MKKFVITVSIFLLLGFVGTASAATITVGNQLSARSTLDGATNIAFLDPTLVFPSDGTLVGFSAYLTDVASTDTFAFQIYRPTNVPTNWTLVYSDSKTGTFPNGVNTFSASFGLMAGDVVGWWFGSGGGVIPYDIPLSDPVQWTNYRFAPITSPVVGDVYSFNTSTWALSSQNREYSISADYVPVPEPASLLLVGAGLGLIQRTLRRRK